MKPRFFATPAAFRRWLEANHQAKRELWVAYYRKETGKPSITWAESVDEALCFGWIDGVRKRIDESSYMNRFTPRRAKSNWSLVNRRRFQELRRRGLVAPAGIRAFEARRPARGGVYSYENRAKAKFSRDEERTFRANPVAWRRFMARPPSYRTLATWYVVTARRPATRARRLQTLIRDSVAGRPPGYARRRPQRPASTT